MAYIEMTLTEWEKKYKPISDCAFLKVNLAKVKPNTIWTECSGFDELMYIINHYAYVNADGFWITEIPYNEKDTICVFIEPRDRYSPEQLDEDGRLIF